MKQLHHFCVPRAGDYSADLNWAFDKHGADAFYRAWTTIRHTARMLIGV